MTSTSPAGVPSSESIGRASTMTLGAEHRRLGAECLLGRHTATGRRLLNSRAQRVAQQVPQFAAGEVRQLARPCAPRTRACPGPRAVRHRRGSSGQRPCRTSPRAPVPRGPPDGTAARFPSRRPARVPAPWRPRAPGPRRPARCGRPRTPARRARGGGPSAGRADRAVPSVGPASDPSSGGPCRSAAAARESESTVGHPRGLGAVAPLARRREHQLPRAAIVQPRGGARGDEQAGRAPAHAGQRPVQVRARGRLRAKRSHHGVDFASQVGGAPQARPIEREHEGVRHCQHAFVLGLTCRRGRREPDEHDAVRAVGADQRHHQARAATPAADRRASPRRGRWARRGRGRAPARRPPVLAGEGTQGSSGRCSTRHPELARRLAVTGSRWTTSDVTPLAASSRCSCSRPSSVAPPSDCTSCRMSCESAGSWAMGSAGILSPAELSAR